MLEMRAASMAIGWHPGAYKKTARRRLILYLLLLPGHLHDRQDDLQNDIAEI